ncbi:MAG: hypothetical protein ACF8XB_13600, partial [Planctomycetota bacterium JB042]
LGWAGKRLAAVSDQADPHWKKANERYLALKAAIEAKAGAGAPAPAAAGYDHAALVQLDKEIRSAFENLKLLSVKHLADAGRVRGIEREIAGFDARLAKFPRGDGNVDIVAGNLDAFRTTFESGMARLTEGQAAKGDVDRGLAALREKYESKNRPQNLSHPFDEAQIRAWAAEMRRWREVELPKDLAWLQQAAGNPAVDRQKVNSMWSWLTGTWTRNLDEVEKLVRERVASDVWQGQETSDFILETDPSDRNHVLGRILGKGRFDENMTWLKDARHAVEMARVYDDAMGAPAVMGPTITDPNAPRPETPDRAAQAAKVEEAIAHLKRIAEQSLAAVRMPEAASTDPELLRIAAETLKRKEYEVNDWERLVVNLDKRRQVRREAWIRPGGASATLSYYEYVWDEFQVTTAERVGDEVWLYSNLLKKYESGDPTSPIGRWVLSRRFELTPILAEHVDE